MSTPEWKQKNAYKNRQYVAKSNEDNVVISVILKPWVIKEIIKVKHSDQPYGGWVRKHIEAWAEKQRLDSEQYPSE